MEKLLRTLLLFLVFEGVAFVAAATIHFGAILDGYEHHRAGRPRP